MGRVYQELLTRLGEEAPQPRLEPVREAMHYLGNPQNSAPVIQVTGTNGKTSVSRMVASLLEAQGLRTGLLTSPHLQNFAERIQISLQPVDEGFLEQTWLDIQFHLQLLDTRLEKTGQPRLTFFECVVILAFACFADAPVDVMVLEVGMGGTWDATNVADAAVCVFTPIALDHTQKLGASVRCIADTKAGIIKHGSLVVSSQQQPEVIESLQRRINELSGTNSAPGLTHSGSAGLTHSGSALVSESAELTNAPLVPVGSSEISRVDYQEDAAPVSLLHSPVAHAAEMLSDNKRVLRYGVDFQVSSQTAVGGQLLDLSGLSGKYSEVFLPLFGTHQGENASLALAAVEAFFNRMPMNKSVVTEGFATVTSPGRLQMVSQNPPVLLDAAHNPHGAKHLAIALKEFFFFEKMVFLMGFLADKDVAGIFHALSETAVEYVVTQPKTPRAMSAYQAYEIAKGIIAEEKLTLRENLDDAFAYSIDRATHEGALVVTGSISMLGQVMDLMS